MVPCTERGQKGEKRVFILMFMSPLLALPYHALLELDPKLLRKEGHEFLFFFGNKRPAADSSTGRTASRSITSNNMSSSSSKSSSMPSSACQASACQVATEQQRLRQSSAPCISCFQRINKHCPGTLTPATHQAPVSAYSSSQTVLCQPYF